MRPKLLTLLMALRRREATCRKQQQTIDTEATPFVAGLALGGAHAYGQVADELEALLQGLGDGVPASAGAVAAAG